VPPTHEPSASLRDQLSTTFATTPATQRASGTLVDRLAVAAVMGVQWGLVGQASEHVRQFDERHRRP